LDGQAIYKLGRMFLEVGHPTEWPASTFETYEQFGGIVEKSLFDNIVATNAYDVQRTLGRLGKPVDRRRWGSSSACDVNSFYSRKVNGIFIPAGILQQPFYSPKQQIARNYGSVGAICGHEMTHGFDGDFPQNSVQIVGQECMLFASHAASVDALSFVGNQSLPWQSHSALQCPFPLEGARVCRLPTQSFATLTRLLRKHRCWEGI